VLRSVKYGLNAAVLAGLIAAPVVWNSVDKSVDLVVDGHSRTVQTTAQSVGQVVTSHGYHVDSHDLLAPSAATHVKDGTRIVLRRGRLLHLDVNGTQAQVWTTAPTVADALSQLGYPTTDFVSVSRAKRLPLAPTDIAIRTPMLVTVVHDGQREQVSTTDRTVAQVLDDIDVTVGATDRISVAPTSVLHAGELVQVQRVDSKMVSRIITVPYSTTRKKDGSLTKGNTKVVSDGKDGKAQVTYSVVYVDGRKVGQTKLRTVTLAGPQPKIEKIGTKDKPIKTTAGSSGGGGAPDAPVPSPGSAKAIARGLLADRGWGPKQYDCLVTLWNHESGWRVGAANPSGAYGIPQALPGSKMATAGSNWRTSATTQIHWGLEYLHDTYGSPCGGWNHELADGWY
jgi:resuscitation-promoting factor RpfB